MKVLLYIEPGSNNGQHVRELVETLVPSENLSVHTNYIEISKELVNPFIQQHSIVVLAVESTTLLAKMAEETIMRNHHKLIAVIPIHNNEAALLGHRLKPRYIGDINSQLNNVATILQNMISKAVSQESAISRPVVTSN